ncbi:MAG: hypothetical protein JWM37_509 [Candidatus Saccharibacteria bacterium]|nr:hypothetical protein [Candidatus Saccharibacteria bacterium]
MQTDTFTYKSYALDESRRSVAFSYALNHDGKSYDFTETLTFPVALPENESIERALRGLHLALGVSYFKIFVPPALIHPYEMDADEAAFWNQVWEHGLGEFLYVNKLSKDRLATFQPQSGQALPLASPTGVKHGALLGIGGGKDSVVAGETLKQVISELEGFVMATGEQLGQTQSVAQVMGIALHVVERRLDPQLLVVQESPGAYKGHVPISLIFGLVGTVLAIASDKRYVVVGNEASASTPRIEWNESSVNHQWSKSFEFEQQLQRYVHRYIDPATTYFSAIRRLSSVAVAKVFAQYPDYFEVFTSDNYVFRIDPGRRPNSRWSLESPKSLSSFILLSPWLAETDLARIFGSNFLDEASLEPLFLRLIGLEGEPPLDCVGTVEELRLSLGLAYQQNKYRDAALTKIAEQRGVFQQALLAEATEALLRPADDSAIPAELASSIDTILADQVKA